MNVDPAGSMWRATYWILCWVLPWPALCLYAVADFSGPVAPLCVLTPFSILGIPFVWASPLLWTAYALILRSSRRYDRRLRIRYTIVTVHLISGALSVFRDGEFYWLEEFSPRVLGILAWWVGFAVLIWSLAFFVPLPSRRHYSTPVKWRRPSRHGLNRLSWQSNRKR